MAGPGYFAGIAQAPFDLAFRGIREVTLHVDFQGTNSDLIYLEEVASDGAGKFTILPQDVIFPVMELGDEQEFLLYQASRESFYFKHRDFRIHETTSFTQNYSVHDLSLTQVIAGRTCETLSIQRQDGTGNTYRVAIDPLTSLVMMEECTQQNGTLVNHLEFQSFVLEADLSDLQLTDHQDPWTAALPAELNIALTSDPLMPVAAPIGFELMGVSYRHDGGIHANETWAMLTYGDGVEQAFFLFRDLDPAQGNTGPQTSLGGMEHDVVSSMTVGPWTILDGRLSGREILVVGRADHGELLLMLQSAVH